MNVHFIAIGGSAMHNLALALHQLGHQVSGSDDQVFEPSKSRLKSAGLLPEEMGWFPDKISKELDLVILGMHAHGDNPELKRAQELGVQVMSYPEFLYHQGKEKTRVVIAGSHGKTTITSMVLHVLNLLGIEEDYMVGALLKGYETMVRLSADSEFFILEGDEYLSSPIDLQPKFLHYKPNIALVSGIAWDHINVFKTYEDYLLQFRKFVDSIEPGGVLIYNQDDPEVVKVVEESKNQIKKFGYGKPQYEVVNNQCILHTTVGELPLNIFGAHNMQNLEGARLICNQLGVMDEDFYEAISSFGGASNRLETLTKNDHSWVIKDFAHAPSKVMATVKAVKEQFPNKKVVAVLELHTYSSLNPDFLPNYKDSLKAADKAVVFYDPHALEIKRLPDLPAGDIQKHFNQEALSVMHSSTELETFLHRAKAKDTVFLMMSSGNFGGLPLSEIAEKLIEL